ncbi:MAG: T6SS immunity protein Tli4 family protein, partial [Desulfobacteraceae bacterium]|nr:T6SS immunity protein Tli4 family protein [Desulfobacteraceae bacterium]
MKSFNEPIVTYGAGRFVMDLPACMEFGGQYSIQSRTLSERVWSAEKPEQEALSAWEEILGNVAKLSPPKGSERAIIETKDLDGIGKHCRAVLYYHDPLDLEYGNLDLILDTGINGLWIKAREKKLAKKDLIYQISTNLARAYRAPTTRFGRVPVIPGKDSFYLQYGAIDLPFEYKESVDIVFKGHPLDQKLTFSVETEVVEKIAQEGLIERLAGMMLTKLGAKMKIEKIRTHKRTVAGLKGEEVIFRGSESDNTKKLAFSWDFPGEKGSAHAPNVTLNMLTDDGHLEKKM